MISQQLIEVRSYRIWEQQGHPHGRHLDHWFQAETELRSAIVVEAEPTRPRKAAAKEAAPADKKTSTVSEAVEKPAKRTTKRKSTKG